MHQSLKDTDGRRRTDEASYVCNEAWQLILATDELFVRHHRASAKVIDSNGRLMSVRTTFHGR